MVTKCDKNKLKLLKIEVPDRYVQENFKRIENHVNEVICPDIGSSSGGDTINNITNVTNINGAWTKFTNTVPALTTKVIDVLALADFHSINYAITLYNDSESKTRTFQMTAFREGVTINTSVYNKQGSLVSLESDVLVNGLNSELTIVNNNNFDLEVGFARLSL